MGDRLKSDTSECERLQKAALTLKTEVTEIESLRRKGEELARTRSREIFNTVSTKFSEFAKLATNGEMDARLGDDMVPSLQGRKIYLIDDASQFERTILDVGFRIALVTTIAEQGSSVPFLILETPDETADESYIEHFAEALRTFSSRISLLITCSNTEFMRNLMKASPGSEKKSRLIDLSEEGTDTQKSYYSPLITQWLGTG
jgi:hypothetical protein